MRVSSACVIRPEGSRSTVYASVSIHPAPNKNNIANRLLYNLYTMAERYLCVSRFAVGCSYFCTLHFALRRHFDPPVSRVRPTPSVSMHFGTRHFAVHRFTVGSSPFADLQFALRTSYASRFAVSHLAVRRFTVGSSPFADVAVRTSALRTSYFAVRSSVVFSTPQYLAVPVLLVPLSVAPLATLFRGRKREDGLLGESEWRWDIATALAQSDWTRSDIGYHKDCMLQHGLD